MKALLTSSFRYMGNFFIPSLELANKKDLTCLFVRYALEDEIHINMCKRILTTCLSIKKMIDLSENYDFKDNIDIVFVNGGITNDLIEKLCKHNQLEKLKKLVIEDNAIYIGESCGSDYAGNYSNYSLLPDFPKDVNIIKKYGEKVYEGFKFINKFILTHACKYRVRRMENGSYYRSHYGDQYKSYLKYLKILKANKIDFETIANNEALLITDNNYKKLKYDWSKFPIKELELTEHEKKLKEMIQCQKNC